MGIGLDLILILMPRFERRARARSVLFCLVLFCVLDSTTDDFVIAILRQRRLSLPAR